MDYSKYNVEVNCIVEAPARKYGNDIVRYTVDVLAPDNNTWLNFERLSSAADAEKVALEISGAFGAEITRIVTLHNNLYPWLENPVGLTVDAFNANTIEHVKHSVRRLFDQGQLLFQNT